MRNSICTPAFVLHLTSSDSNPHNFDNSPHNDFLFLHLPPNKQQHHLQPHRPLHSSSLAFTHSFSPPLPGGCSSKSHQRPPHRHHLRLAHLQWWLPRRTLRRPLPTRPLKGGWLQWHRHSARSMLLRRHPAREPAARPSGSGREPGWHRALGHGAFRSSSCCWIGGARKRFEEIVREH